MDLSTERAGEIACAVLRAKVKDDGILIDPNFRHRVGMMAEKTGIPFAELLKFFVAEASAILGEVARLDEPQTNAEKAFAAQQCKRLRHHEHGGGH